MILFCVNVSKTYISGILFDEDKKKVLDCIFLYLPYDPDFTCSLITSKKLESLLLATLKKLKLDPEYVKPILISNEFESDIEFHYQAEKLIEDYNSKLLTLDYTKYENINLNKEDLNLLKNLSYYHKKLPMDLRLEADSKTAIKIFKSNNIFERQNYSLEISTLLIDTKHQKEYLEGLINKIISQLKYDGVYKLSFDFNFSLIPLLAALKETKTDFGEFSKDNQIFDTIKIIFLKEVKDLKIIKNNDQIKIELSRSDLINIDVSENEKIDVFWHAGHSKFKGELYGTNHGIYLVLGQ